MDVRMCASSPFNHYGFRGGGMGGGAQLERCDIEEGPGTHIERGVGTLIERGVGTNSVFGLRIYQV